MIVVTLCSAILLGDLGSDVKTVECYSYKDDAKSAVRAFLRLSANSRIEWPLTEPDLFGQARSGFVRAANTNSFLAEIRNHACYLEHPKRSDKEVWVVSHGSIRALAMVTSESLKQYSRLVSNEVSREKSAYVISKLAHMLATIRFAANKLPSYDKVEKARLLKVVEIWPFKTPLKEPTRAKEIALADWKSMATQLDHLFPPV